MHQTKNGDYVYKNPVKKGFSQGLRKELEKLFVDNGCTDEDSVCRWVHMTRGCLLCGDKSAGNEFGTGCIIPEKQHEYIDTATSGVGILFSWCEVCEDTYKATGRSAEEECRNLQKILENDMTPKEKKSFGDQGSI